MSTFGRALLTGVKTFERAFFGRRGGELALCNEHVRECTFMGVRTEKCSEHFWEGTLLRVCVRTAFTVYAVLFSVNCALLHTFR